ncbi:hypothetical protein BEWA_009570 [Theileria equi strain WA]|uniref:BSD domain-containing protein n=1 Tax=Theileria equi strain WA TaxID=1537102 RepID=L0B221_THEEQ|nr:hypothetical protein BEWA_009570 [Theileria equi strain WA]AFZ81543.1 hypothetical protein BEWA_009570 [Theileria equi strain WA]|eukprot:XP_004831209.1 hypothetical protein BEWA_009570 [Theileria equi strain WA]
MNDSVFCGVSIDGISGTCLINDASLSFRVSESVYKWSFSDWLRYEKSKKSAKVRLTFRENSIRLNTDNSDYDILIKPVIVVDFGDDRNKLEEFCALVSSETNKAKLASAPTSQIVEEPIIVAEAPRKQGHTAKTGTEADNLSDNQKRLLEIDDTIAKLYSQLVDTKTSDLGNCIASKEFWDHHKLELVSATPQNTAESNLDGFVSIPPASNFVNGQRVFSYSKELASSLLAEDETIRDLHKKLVLDKHYPEESFWKRILQSNYFYNLIGEKIPENQILYDDIRGIPIKASALVHFDVNKLLSDIDSSSELLTVEDHKKAVPKKDRLHASKRFGKNIRPENTGRILLERFNKHSSNIINACESLISNPIDTTDRVSDYKTLQNRVENDRKRKLLIGECEDLQDNQSDCLSNDLCLIKSLNIPGKDTDRINIKSEQVNSRPIKVAISSNTGYYNKWLNDMKTFDITNYFKESKTDHNISRRMFILNTKLCQYEKLIQLVPFEYDPTIVNSMKEIQLQIIELLQMYYKTLIPEEDRRYKLLNVVRSAKHQLELLEVGMSVHTAKALQTGLLDQITAVEAYNTKLKSFVANLRSQNQPRISR